METSFMMTFHAQPLSPQPYDAFISLRLPLPRPFRAEYRWITHGMEEKVGALQFSVKGKTVLLHWHITAITPSCYFGATSRFETRVR